MHTYADLSTSSKPSPGPALRVSDRDREDVVSALRQHAGAGRLDVDELDERLDRAWAARTGAELERLTADLPKVGSARRRAAKRSAERRELRHHATIYGLVMLLLVAVWALSGAGYFWPVWPMLGWGIGVASHGAEALGLPRARRARS
jgi:hypothetical protein